MPQTPAEFVFSFAIITLAGYVRGYGGFGFSMITVVGLTLLFPPAVVVPVVLLLEVLASAIPAVLVANAADEVRRQALERSAAGGWMRQLHLATGGWSGLNGNYAAGILEGIAHYHPDLTDLLEAEI